MTNATVRRAFFALYVRQGREQAGLELVDAAKLLVGPDATEKALSNAITTLSKVENQKHKLPHAKARQLFEGFGYDAEKIEFLVELSKTRDTRGRWSGDRASVPLKQRAYYDFEEAASGVNKYLTEVIPGQLQIEEYMRAELASNPRPVQGRSLELAQQRFGEDRSVEELIELDTDSIVTTRLARQRRMLDGPRQPDLHFILSESCLRRIYGGNAVMTSQMGHLIALSNRPNVRIQILPFTAPATPYTFTKLRIPPLWETDSPLDLVYSETMHEADYLDGPSDLADYESLWGHLTSGALSRNESRRLILRYAEEYS